MGTLNLICPMCCGETFSDSQSLKYHLLSMVDNLYCPECSHQEDSVLGLIEHLDKCHTNNDMVVKKDEPRNAPTEEPKEESTKILMERNGRGFLTAPNGEIMIVGRTQGIQLNENGEIKVMEKMEMDEESQTCSVDVQDFSLARMKKGTSLKSIDRSDDQTEDNSVISLISNTETLVDESDQSLINIDQGDQDDSGLLRVKQELCETEASDSLYSCSSCGMSFNSVLEHIKQFHEGQEVVLEMAEQQAMPESPPPSQPAVAAVVPGVNATAASQGNVVTLRQRQTMNTLRTEECVDSEGRLYTRKVVQIERFWDQRNHPEHNSRSKASPMIEKFFSNVQGVKVREKSSGGAANPQTKVYQCTQCLEKFPKLGEFRMHPCIHGMNQCDHCDQAFATPKALQLHVKTHEESGTIPKQNFTCGICGTEFSTHKSLRLHSRMHAPVRARHVDAPEGAPASTGHFTCLECGKTLSESYKDAHMALHTSGAVTCAVCNRKFDTAESLAMHAAVHNELQQVRVSSPLTLNNCTVTNVTSALTAAENTSQLNPSSTDTSMNVAQEETAGGAAATSADSQKPYRCQHCGRRFARPHEKVKHERIHTGEKPHACEVCGKTFRVSYCLTLHMRTHTGVRPYACQHCGKRFKASSVYNHHLLTHGDERAYTCPFCPKTFKTRVQLAGHKNSHTKPFRCTECSRPFASLYAARSHIQTHKKDNNLKFSCYICGASYGRAFALKDHLRQHGQDGQVSQEPTQVQEIIIHHTPDDFLLAEEEVEDDELVVPSPVDPPMQSSEPEESE